MRKYSSKRCQQGRIAYRVPDRFIYQKYQKVIKSKPKQKLNKGK
jgi:hypothetical protein